MPVVQPGGEQTVEHSYVGFSHHIDTCVYALLHHPREVIHCLTLIHHSLKHCLLLAFDSRLGSVACSLRVDVYRYSSVLSLAITPYGKTVSPSSLLDYDGIGVVS